MHMHFVFLRLKERITKKYQNFFISKTVVFFSLLLFYCINYVYFLKIFKSKLLTNQIKINIFLLNFSFFSKKKNINFFLFSKEKSLKNAR